MDDLHPAIPAEVTALGADTSSGSSQLIGRAIALLARAVRESAERAGGAGGSEWLACRVRAVALAQPSMGAFWNAAALALAPPPHGGLAGLDRLSLAVERAPRALSRAAVPALRTGLPAGAPLRLVTCSFSGSVLACCAALAEAGPLVVSCGEGRPVMEGRRLAEALTAAGVDVRLLTDGALGLALEDAAALLVGADAVAPSAWVNKAGTGPLAAAATARGIPVFVVASRDKFVPARLDRLVRVPDRPPEEVWAGSPAGVTVVNRYFERVPLEWSTAFITEAGVITPDAVPEVCRTNGRLLTGEIAARLAGAV